MTISFLEIVGKIIVLFVFADGTEKTGWYWLSAAYVDVTDESRLMNRIEGQGPFKTRGGAIRAGLEGRRNDTV